MFIYNKRRCKNKVLMEEMLFCCCSIILNVNCECWFIKVVILRKELYIVER